MTRKYIFGLLATLLVLTSFSSAVFAKAPEVIITNSGLALLIGETYVEPGSSVVVQVVPKDEGPLTSDGKINGYLNETLVGRDGKYNLLFSLSDIYESDTEYECHIDVASKEYFCIPVIEGSLIEISLNKFDRDTKTITIAGSLWDSNVFGSNLILTIDNFTKTVQTSNDGKFNFEFTMDDAGITTYGVHNYVIAYADDSSSYSENSIGIFDAEPVLSDIKTYSKNSVELERILTDSPNIEILGFDSSVLYGDCDLSELAGSKFFEKLSKTDVKADKVSELETSIKTAYTLYSMEVNPSDINLRRCIELFGLPSNDEITNIYNNFNFTQGTEPEYLFELWKTADFANVTDACAFYKEAVIRTKLNTAEVWSTLMGFVNSNHILLGVREQNSADFWQKLIYKAPFTSLTDFKTKYNQVLNMRDDKPTGGSTSGSGGFIISGPTSEQIVQPSQNKPTETVFKDMGSAHWAIEPVNKLYEMGIISGKANGEFAPNDLVTRAEVAKLMCASAKIEKSEAIEGNFTDISNSHWAVGYIEAAFKNGLVSGRGNNNYGPEDCTTREDMAVFCYRLYKTINPEYNESINVTDNLTFKDSELISNYALEAVAAMTKLGIINGKGDNMFDPKAYCTRAEAAKIFYGVLQ